MQRVRPRWERTGGAVVVDESHRMLGIFTHDNFARHFQKVERIADRAVGEFLTKEPATVGEGRLAADVLRVLEQHRVDEVVGVDGGWNTGWIGGFAGSCAVAFGVGAPK